MVQHAAAVAGNARSSQAVRAVQKRRWPRWRPALTDESIDVSHRGEILLVLARWVLIVVGLALALNAPDSVSDLQVTIVGIFGLAVVNFLLQTNLLRSRASSRVVLYLMSAADIVVITAVVGITGGFDSYAVVFYFVAILAYSLVFPFRVTAQLTAAALVLYAAVSLGVSGPEISDDTQLFAATLATRLTTFGAVSVVAGAYRLVERQRLEDEVKAASPPAPRRRRTSPRKPDAARSISSPGTQEA